MKRQNSNDLDRQLEKLRRDKRFLWVGILFFVLVVLWILASIFATTKTSSITAEQQLLAKSFVPRLESKIFEEMKAKRSFSEEELAAFPIYVFSQDVLGEGVQLLDIMADNRLDTEQSLAAIGETIKAEETVNLATASDTADLNQTIEASESTSGEITE